MLNSIVYLETKEARKVFWSSTLTYTQSISVKDIIFHSKARRKHTTADPTLHKKIHDFYERDTISQVLLYKNLMRKIKLPIGALHVPIWVMKMTYLKHIVNSLKVTSTAKQ